MPKVLRLKHPPPEGWELIEPTLNELENKMREAENEVHEGKTKSQIMWPIIRVHHQRSRYVYEMFFKRKEISKELYDWCVKMGYADANLIAKWKKPGYNNLCCLRCIQKKDTNFNASCVCRVPKSNIDPNKRIECQNCGCRGCA